MKVRFEIPITKEISTLGGWDNCYVHYGTYDEETWLKDYNENYGSNFTDVDIDEALEFYMGRNPRFIFDW